MIKYIIGPEELNHSFCNEFDICITKTCGQNCPKQNICVKCSSQCASKHNCIHWCATLSHCNPGQTGYSPASI